MLDSRETCITSLKIEIGHRILFIMIILMLSFFQRHGKEKTTWSKHLWGLNNTGTNHKINEKLAPLNHYDVTLLRYDCLRQDGQCMAKKQH